MVNYHITDADDLAGGGAKTKARKNIAAIRLLKELEKEQRSATSEEQAILIRYAGWGVAADIFTTKKEWATLREELEDTLTKDEFAAARASTINAFYTDIDIAAEIYKGVKRLGFAGGTVLDPSMGATGIFEGIMPTDMASRSKISGIELDSISGRIASRLYPESAVYVQGFQDVILPDDHFDLTISNVPFSEVGIKDPRYKGQPVNTLHDYFFAKGLDKVRPGGLLVYITSTGTMQSAKGEPFRQYLSNRANLVGAMRLPGDAFKKNAGTEVTTDLIILQKLGDGIEPNGVAWTALEETDILDSEGKPLRTNEYYAKQPELMLGELCDDKLYPGRLALKGDGRDISQAIRQAFEALPEAIYQQRLNLETEDERILVPPELQTKVKQSAFTLYNGELMVRSGDYLEPKELTGKPYERIIGLMSVRDAVQRVFDVQLREGTDLELEEAQTLLSKTYDDFVKANGYIHTAGNKRVYQRDPDYPLLLALERYDPEEKTAKKTDIFSKRTIQAYKPRTEAENPKEGLLFSLNEYGRVDIGYIAKLTSQSRLEVVLELQREQLIFRDPAAQEWQTQDEYLSGNVKQKLEIAREAAKEDSQFATNVEALEAVQPEPLLPGDIDVRLGSIWVPEADVEAFAQELLGIDKGLRINHSQSANKWYVKAIPSVRELSSNIDIYGTEDVEAAQLIELALNLGNPTVYKPDPNDPDRRVIDQDRTAAARLKQEEIKEKFKDWVWQNPERTTRLTDRYNDIFNTHRERQYDGSHLELPGKNPNFVLRKHQSDAVYRSLSGNMLLAHVVGAGKTAEMICSAMEQKRLGLASKPMFVVPNHLLEQWAGEIKHLYPTANILAATKKDSSAANRQQLMSRIATGQWDAVVVTHTAFEKLQLSEAAQTQFLSEEYEKVREAILSLSKGGEESRRVMKDLERKKLSLEGRIDEVANSSAKDNTLTFEQLGIDLLVVDESHYFKNLGYVTKMRNIAGLPNTESKRAFDMHMKVRYMAQVRGEGKGVIFATGTPIANSMAELYTVQRYLQPEELERMGLASFDDWASVFGETVTSAELAATGKFQVKTRFSSFVNLPELMSSVRQVMDIQTADMLKLPVPKLLRGKPTIVAVPATDDQLAYMERLVKRAENMRNVDPRDDNMLKLTGNGRSASADMRLLFNNEPDDPESKINRFVDDAFDFWKEHGSNKTHLVFCDLGTPKKAGEFSLYQDIKNKLTRRGVPESAIAFAQDYKTDAKKLQLQQNFNKGKVAILLSGAQLETGFNGQRKLARISHLTVPWRPDQIEQRDGRMIRQGNENDVVESRRYVTQGRNGQPGIDGYFWQTLETKAGFIAQVMKGSTDVRRMSDVSSEALNYSEIKAIATGNPLIMEKATLDNTIRQLSAQKRAHTNTNYRIRQELNKLPAKIDRLTETLRKTELDLDKAQKAQQAGKVTLFGQTLSLGLEDEIGKRIRSTAVALTGKEEKSDEKIGQFGEFNLYLQSAGDGNSRLTYLRIEGENQYYRDKISGSKANAYRPLKELETDLAKKSNDLSSQLDARKKDLKDLSQQTDKPFSKEDELAAANKRLAEVLEELKADTEKSREATATTQHRIAPSEQQETMATDRIAQLITSLGLEHDVVSKEGFYLALKSTDRKADLIIDSDDGERIKFTTDLLGSSADYHAKGAVLTFLVNSDGILALESGEVESGPNLDKQLLAVRFSQHLSNTEYNRLSTAKQVVEDSGIEPSDVIAPEETKGEPTQAIASEETEVFTDAKTATSHSNIAEEQNSQPQLESVEDEASRQPDIQSGINNRMDSELPEEEVTLRIRSLYSGVESEVTLPATGPSNKAAEVKSTAGVENEKSTSQNAAADSQPETAGSLQIYEGKHITISRNLEQKGIEIRFTEKPSKEWILRLKAQKFRFSQKGGDPRWYRQESRVSIPLLTDLAKKYESTIAASSQAHEETSKSAFTSQRHQQKANATKQANTEKMRPNFKRYLEQKEKHSESIVLIRTAIGFLEAYKEDAVITSKALDISLASVSSKSKQYGNVDIARIYWSAAEPSIEKLQELGSVAVVERDDKVTVHQKVESTLSVQSIRAVEEQPDRSGQKAAEFVYAAGLESKLIQENGFRLEVENGVFKPLVVESSLSEDGSKLLRLSQYAKGTHLRKLIREAVFDVATDGVLTLRETSTQSPETRGGLRKDEGGDRAFASAMIENIIGQKYAEHIRYPSTATKQKGTRASEQPGTDQESSITHEQGSIQLDLYSLSRHSDETLQPVPQRERTPALEQKEPLASETKISAEPKLEVMRTAQVSSPEQSSLGTNIKVAEKTQTASQQTQLTGHNHIEASSVIKAALEQRDPKLHAALTAPKPTVSVSIEKLRNWYAAVQYQQKQPSPEHLEAIKKKGIEAASTGSINLTQDEAASMESDIRQFTSDRAETTIENLRIWYRANLAGDRSQLSAIRTIAEGAKASGKTSVQLSPANQLRMESEIKRFQTQIATQVEPNLRSIWSIATANQLTKPYAEGKAIFPGQNYSIVSGEDSVLTVVHNATERKLSLAKSGEVLENSLTLEHSKEIGAIAQKMTAIVSRSKKPQMQA